jgi:hypothetical protein
MSEAGALLARAARLEEAKAALAAEQAAVLRDFARARVESQIAAGDFDPVKVEHGIVAEIALALRMSPFHGRKQLRIARDLHDGLTHVRALFAAGLLSEYKVSLIVAATAHLSPSERAAVDQRLAAHHLETLSVRRIETLARSLAAEIAPEAFAARCRAARTDRRVSVRPAADGMADLTAHLPVEQAVACYAACVQAANDLAASPEPLTRSRGQIMADTLVERITGHTVASKVNIEVQVLVPLETLIDTDSPLPVEIPGYGPLPADLLLSDDACTAWRRLITKDGVVIGGDSRRRTYTGTLATFIKTRDGHRCAEPYCDAPIRHLDHIKRWSEGGTTTFDNGRGLCEFHNHVRELKNWDVQRVGDTITTTTPTGARYSYVIGTTAGKPSTVTVGPPPRPPPPPAHG